MSDFHQFGPVTALPRLVARPVEELEARIQIFAKRFPVALVIPMLPAEMERQALAGILEELRQVSYLDTLVVSLNQASQLDYLRTQEYFAPYTRRKVISVGETPGSAGETPRV